MAEEEVKVVCPVCEREVGTKEDGTLIRAHKIAGERCAGSDEPVSSDDVAPIGLDRGDPFEELESSQDDSHETDEQNDTHTPEEPQTGTQGVASSIAAPEFVHTVVVANPCPYLGDPTWHHQNILMTQAEAQRAGHVLAGAEARFVEAAEQGDKIVLTYSVAVK